MLWVELVFNYKFTFPLIELPLWNIEFSQTFLVADTMVLTMLDDVLNFFSSHSKIRFTQK